MTPLCAPILAPHNDIPSPSSALQHNSPHYRSSWSSIWLMVEHPSSSKSSLIRCTDIHGSQMMHPGDFRDPLTFPSVSYLLKGLPMNLSPTFVFPAEWILTTWWHHQVKLTICPTPLVWFLTIHPSIHIICSSLLCAGDDPSRHWAHVGARQVITRLTNNHSQSHSQL